MKTYFIFTYRDEESELVMNKLKEFKVINLKRKSAIMYYETISFECKKREWKKIKSKLNLETTSVFAKIRVEA